MKIRKSAAAQGSIRAISRGTIGKARSRAKVIRASGTAVAALGAMVSGLFTLSSGYGATITTDGNDAAGTTTFLNGTNFVGGAAPSPGNDYIVNGTDQIRTPITGTLFTFAGNSLTLGDGTTTGYGILTFKGQVGDTLTINNFTLNSGIIQSGGTSAGTANPWTLASSGAITVGTGGFAIDNGGVTARTEDIAANLVGSGNLEVINNSRTAATATNSINGGTLMLTGTNNLWTGTVLIEGGALQVGIGGTAGTLGTGALDVDNILNFDLTSNQSYTQAITNDATQSGTIENTGTGSIGLAGVTVNGTMGLSNGAGALTFSGGISQTAASALGITNTTGTMALSGGIATGGGLVTVTNGGGLVTIGAITGTGGLTLAATGSGTTNLTGTNTYTGNTTVNAGTLRLAAGATTPASNNWAVNGTLDLSSGTGALTTTIAGSIGGLGTILANSSGVTSAGVFAPGSGATIGTLSVNGHLTFSGGTINTTLNAASTSSGNDLISVSGTGAGLTLNGSIALNPTFVGGTPTVGSQYEIIGYTGSLSGSGAIVPESRSLEIITTTTGEIIAQVTTAQAANLVWDSTSNQTWDIVDAPNWNDAGSQSAFYQGDNVTFNDSVSGVQQTVNLTAQVAPGSVTVNSTAKNYVFGGTGGISGGTSLAITLGASNSLTITTNNTYSGGTIINSGLVQIGTGGGTNTSGNLGSGAVTDNGMILFGRSDAPAIANTITGNGGLEFGNASGSIVSGGGTLDPTGTSTFTGGTTINSGSVFPVGLSALGAATSTVTINTNGELYSVAANGTYDQPIVLNGVGPTSTVVTGVLHAGGATLSTFTNSVAVISDSIINVDSGATLALTGTNALTSSNGSLVEAAGSGVLALGGNMNLGSGGTLYAGAVQFVPATGQTITMSTPIADNSPSIGSPNQNGAGTTVLAVDNSYSGTTTVTTGTLEPESANAIPISSTIFIVGNSATGALGLTGVGITNITNAFSINGRPAINTPGILNISGNNTISGPMTVNTGGTNYDYESDAGTLTISGTLTTSAGVTGARVVSLLGTSGGVGNWTSVIANGATSTMSVEKTEAGSWSISNSGNTYSGGTIVGGGTLVVNATSGALGTGNVTMQGGTLASAAGASDSIVGSVVDGATASYTVAPGGIGTVGTLGIGGITTSSLGALSFQLGTGGSVVTNGSVLLLGSGTVSIGSGTIISVTGTPTVGKDYRIIGGTISGLESQESDFVIPQVGTVGFVFNNTVDSGFVDLQAVVAGPPTLTWNDASADNLWNTTSSNWNSGASTTTYSNGSNVTFNDNNGGNYSVTLNTSVTPAAVIVNNGSGNYTINGTGGITGTTALSKSGGDKLTLGTVNTYTGGTNVSAGTLVVGVNGALPSGAVNITGGTLQLAASTGLATVTSLAISGNGTFDVNNNHVIINYGSGPDPIASIAALLASGYAGGSWAGLTGIVSTAAAANSFSYGLGYADSADTGNPANLTAGTIEIKYTLLGDVNLDGVVNGVDFGILAANFNKGVTGWDKGDFNYDNVVNGSDFGLLAANFNKGATGTSIGEPAYDDPALVAFAAANGLLADVPEPATAGLLVVAGLGVLGRRRRRCN